jgi:transposase
LKYVVNLSEAFIFTLFPHKEQTMLFVGIDLHKKSITLCVMNQARAVLTQRRFLCAEADRLRAFFAALGPFQAVVEATASYEWLWELLQPLAQRLILAHPKKLRVIAESTRKSDQLDAKVLAEFLALDMIPQAYRPTPRQRQHRALVRQREFISQSITAVKNKMRRVLSDYNADRRDLFSVQGQAYLLETKVSAADRFVLDQLYQHWQHLEKQRRAADKALRDFAKTAPVAEAEARAALATIPEVGPVTIDIVISEIGDVRRFRSAKQVVAYAGLAPGRRESAGKSKDLGITKEGSRRLRWALVEAAWRIVRRSPRWQTIYEQLHKRRGKKKAIVAVARRLLTVMVALMRSGKTYQALAGPPPSTAEAGASVAKPAAPEPAVAT